MLRLKPRMLQRIQGSWSRPFSELQEPLTQLLGLQAALHRVPLRPSLVQVEPNHLLLGGIGHAPLQFERHLIGHHLEHDAAHAPYVCLRPAATTEHLWRHGGRRSSDTCPSRPEEAATHDFGGAQVADDDMRLVSKVLAFVIHGVVEQQDVLALEILVDNTFSMEVSQSLKSLSNGSGCPPLFHGFAICTPFADGRQDFTARAILHHQSCRVSVLKPGKDSHNVRVVKMFHDIPLHPQTILIPTLRAHN
mmetsp:Transcript_98243/g.177375  ORF Transcript_98243/g.177375 Transcript_98243/m.177375 type:complete len:249 (-) Transcript_98243:317-1063(-)